MTILLFFYNYELPNINSSKVDSFTIFVFTDSQAPHEVCNDMSGSIYLLQQDVNTVINSVSAPIYCINDAPCFLKIACQYSLNVNKMNYKGQPQCCEEIFDDTLLPNFCDISIDPFFCTKLGITNSGMKLVSIRKLLLFPIFTYIFIIILHE